MHHFGFEKRISQLEMAFGLNPLVLNQIVYPMLIPLCAGSCCFWCACCATGWVLTGQSESSDGWPPAFSQAMFPADPQVSEIQSKDWPFFDEKLSLCKQAEQRISEKLKIALFMAVWLDGMETPKLFWCKVFVVRGSVALKPRRLESSLSSESNCHLEIQGRVGTVKP